MIVWVASYPRSGSNLTMLTLGRIFGFKKGMTAHPEKTLKRFDLPTDSEFLPALMELDQTVFLKTHRLPRPEDESPAIYLVRDGRDAVVSFAHYVRGRGQKGFKDLDFEETLEKIITKSMVNGTWSENARSWTGRAAQTTVVHFERLIDDPSAALGDAIDALGLTPPKRRKKLPSFEELHERDPVMFRRGKVGTWRTELPAALEERFWELHGSQMEALGYER